MTLVLECKKVIGGMWDNELEQSFWSFEWTRYSRRLEMALLPRCAIYSNWIAEHEFPNNYSARQNLR
jgi:hypothetical protein